MSPESAKITELPFRLFIESVQDYAIFMLDPDGYIVSWNQGAERINGYSEQEIIGQHFSIFFSEADRARGHPEDELRMAREAGRHEEEGWRFRKDGTRFWSNVVITAVRDHTGKLLGFGKVTRDLTQRRMHEQREVELRHEQQARTEAEAANRAKSQFLTTMSHELRTPLNAIIGYVELLELGVQGPLTDQQRLSLDRVRKSSKHLLALINDVLNVARVESGKLNFEIHAESANELLVTVEPLVTPQFAARGVTFIRVACDPSLRVLCDRDRTQQILINLLTNAYKFTDTGGTVELACRRAGDQGEFTVTDSGRGIPPEKLASIFDPFVQIDRYLNTQSQQGVGLGLSISRDLARRMDGELVVQSRLGEGTRFTLTLPIAQRSPHLGPED